MDDKFYKETMAKVDRAHEIAAELLVAVPALAESSPGVAHMAFGIAFAYMGVILGFSVDEPLIQDFLRKMNENGIKEFAGLEEKLKVARTTIPYTPTDKKDQN